MRDGGRIAAAIEVLADMAARHRPAHLALRNWGNDARYAGAKDRAFVSGLVLDVLRHQRSLDALTFGESPRGRVLGALRILWGWTLDRLSAAAGEAHGPGELSPEERAILSIYRGPSETPGAFITIPAAGTESGWTDVNGVPMKTADLLAVFQQGSPTPLPPAPPGFAVAQRLGEVSMAVRGDYPDWMDSHLARVFGDARALEGEAMAARAPVDLRVNALKSDAAHVLKALAPFGPVALDFPVGAIRIAPPAASERAAPVESAPEFAKGWFEVQDAGSQIAAAVAGEIKGQQVLDFCAGGGGKTLALAAAMGNSGQLYAYDSDARRLSETVTRSQRAGVRNLQVRSPLRDDALAGLEGRMDLVFVDAPCTGSGTWRRHPDAKWRLTPEQLERRIAEQDAILAAASAFVKPGGRLIYVTCSLFAEENEDRVAAFVAAHLDFAVQPVAPAGAEAWRTDAGFLRLTPRKAGTDGFFVASLARAKP